MLLLIARRMLGMIPQLLLVTLLAFALLSLAPGDALSAQRGNPMIPRELVERLERAYGLDRPVFEQYVRWLGRAVRGDLGYSFKFQRPVADVLHERLGATLLLSLFSSGIAWLIAVPMGVWAATRRSGWPDRTITFIAFVGMSVPSFLLALLLLYAASVLPPLPLIGRIPIGGITSPDFLTMGPLERVGDLLRHLLIPGTVLAVGALAGLQRLSRGAMLETLRQPYVLAARARGLSGRAVIWRHAFRNAANPLITIFGFEFSALLSGAAFTEIVVSWPGMGLLALEAVRSQDMFVVMATVTMGAAMLLLGNLVADLLQACNDPRVRREVRP